MRFSLGVNYWPRGGALTLWRRFDAGEVANDFAHIAALGLDTVRFFVRWEDAAPDPATIDDTVLERVAQTVDLAGAAGLRALPVLFTGHFGGANWLPAWAVEAGPSTRRAPTFVADAPSSSVARSLYAGPLLEAQLHLARTLGERLRGHPAVFAWDIGHAFSSLSAPSSKRVRSGEHSRAPADERIVAQWSARLSETLRTVSGAPVTAGMQSADLLEDRGIRLDSLCAPLDFASMQGSNVCLPFARSRLDPEAIPFLAMLAAGFSHRPVLVSGLGHPVCPPGKFSAVERFAAEGEPAPVPIADDDPVFANYPCLTDDEAAHVCEQLLERLHADGRLGVLWWGWTDVDAAAPGSSPTANCCGIVRGDGSERPVAATLAAFARRALDVVPPADLPAIAPAYYYRTLPTSTRTLYDAFLRFTSDRRG